MKKQAFTLAEVIVVIVVIGILAAIVLPTARNIVPDRNLMKFKKAHTTLGNVIRELVTNEEYYKEGDLSYKVNGGDVNSTFLCKTMAELLNTKSVSCTEFGNNAYKYNDTTVGSTADTHCQQTQKNNYAKAQITLPDGVIIYEANSKYHYAIVESSKRVYDATNADGFLKIYKVICIDIDGWNKGENPFAYGIRKDGKIEFSTRTKSWLEKED